ncbi:MAG TPA: response regulator [Blastocatellia bacterium]|nr:response regulator [Blastocatellia bacterium]
MAKIVFCEDNLVAQKLIRAALKPTSHELHFASNGSEGLKLVEQVRPNIIFTDVHMDEMTGLELLSAVKAREDLAHIPVVLMTASIQSSYLEEGYRGGAADHILKPFTPDELLAKVEKHVSDLQTFPLSPG